jgi:hypothetical protein
MPNSPRVDNPVGRQAFQHELKTRGIKGFTNWQDDIASQQAASKKRDFDNTAEAKSKEFVWENTLKFGYSHIPDSRWPFPPKEIQHGRSDPSGS